MGRRSKKQDPRKRSTEERQGRPAKQRKAETSTSTSSSRREAPRRVHPPKTTAVTISMAPGSKRTVNEALIFARRRISLSEMGLDEVKIKPTISGAALIEVLGEDNASKADALADKLREIFPEGGGRGCIHTQEKGRRTDPGSGRVHPTEGSSPLHRRSRGLRGGRGQSGSAEEALSRRFAHCLGPVPGRSCEKACRQRQAPSWLDFSPGGSPQKQISDLL